MRIIITFLLLMALIIPVSAIGVPTGFNTSNATQSMTNWNEYNATEFNLTDYRITEVLFRVDVNNTTSLIDATTFPITDYWLTWEYGMGYWFYAVIVLLTVGVIYIKTKSLIKYLRLM